MEYWKNTLHLEDNEYLRVNISLYKCTELLDSCDESGSTETTPDPQQTTTSKPPLLKNVLGENVFNRLQSWFTDTGTEKFVDIEQTVTDVDPCQLIYSHETSFQQAGLIYLFLTLVITLCAILISIVIVRKLIRKLKVGGDCDSLHNKTDSAIVDQKVGEDDASVETLTECSSNEPPITVPNGIQIKKTEKPQIGTSLVYQGELTCNSPSEKRLEAFPFLEKTSDKLFKKLDKLLLKGMAEGQNTPQASQSTPQPTRRRFQRRQRTGSSPMLASMVDSVENNQDDNENVEQEIAWNDFKLFSASLNWKYPPLSRVDPTHFPPNVQKLLHYYQRVAPIPPNAWKTSTLIVNYVLYLISMELSCLKTKTGYRFIEFRGTGSVKNGTKVSKCNQFDVQMLLQPPAPPDVVIGNTVDMIPPGMVVVGSRTRTEKLGKNVVSRIDLNGTHVYGLSSKECMIAAEDLLEESLHSLYTTTRSALDRLPFQVKGAPNGASSIDINTRALVGFGESEIRIRLQPVLRLPISGWFQKPVLYATPPAPSESDARPREGTSLGGIVNYDYLWNLETCELDCMFNEEVNMMMKHARVNSCHLVCLMILKCLLTGCRKTTLVDRGVFPAYHISSVMNYLMLESTPIQWTFDRLADRFSDAIHFLQSAYESSRLPEFFISNPHLIEKMSCVSNNEMLVKKRQKNALLDSSRESLDKRIDYLKSCLRESGLKDCVKEEFSSDMWEFEFFLFS